MGAIGILFVGGVHCATSGKDFSSQTDWIRKNQTKQRDVVSVLGEPNSVGSAGGTPTWTYGYYRYEVFGRSNHKELKLYWNDDRTVDHYSFDSSFSGDIKAAQAAQSAGPKPD